MSRPTPSRIARLLAGCALLAAAGGLPVAAADNEVKPYEGVDSGSVVDIDLLGGARILDPLPFDVQFYFQSPILEDTTQATGRYLGSKKPAFCVDLYPDLTPDQQAYLRFDPPTAPAPPAAATPIQLRVIDRDGTNLRSVSLRPPAPATPVVAVEEAEAPPPLRRGERPITFVRFIKKTDGKKEKVELSVPGVLPNRYYCFEFVLTRKPSDPAALRPALAEQINQELQNPDYVVADPDPQRPGRLIYRTTNTWLGLHQIRVALIDAIRAQLQEGEKIVAPSGSFLNPETPLRQVAVEYRDQFDRVLEAQNQRFARARQFESWWQEADVRLHELLRDPAFQALRPTPAARAHLAGREEVLDLTAGVLRATAQGSAPGTTPDLLAVWLPGGLDDRIDRLNTTLLSLERFNSLLNRAQNAAFATSLGITPADATRLQGLVTNTTTFSEGAIQLLSSVRDEVLALQALLRAREEQILDLVDQLSSLLQDTVRIQGTSIASYEVRAGWYISADVGQGWAGDLDELFTYVGTNIYFRPINKKAPLRGGIRKRFSIVVGITNEDLEQAGRLEGVIGKAPLIVGGGFRISDHFRLNAGVLIFNEIDPSPLVSTTELASSWFVSASIDWNVRRLFSTFGGAFGLNGDDDGND